MKPLFIASVFALAFFIAPAAHAATNPFSSIAFPIADLGGCASLSDCKAYCDIADNAAACTTWGQAHGLIPKAPPANPALSAIEKILKTATGPGGCTSAEACKAYCADSAHQDECVAFARAHDFLSKDDQRRLDAASTTLRMGDKPPHPPLTGQGSTTAPWPKFPCKGDDCTHASSTPDGGPRPGMPGDWHGSTTPPMGGDHPPFMGPNASSTPGRAGPPRGPKPPQDGGPSAGSVQSRLYDFSHMGADAGAAFNRGLGWLLDF